MRGKIVIEEKTCQNAENKQTFDFGVKIGIEGTKNLSNVDDYLFWLILIAGHSFRSRDHPFASGISDWSISSEDDKDKPEPEVFISTTRAYADALAN